MSELIKSIKCPNCNGSVKLDFDNLASYCPYCGSQLMIDLATAQNILREKERTKRAIYKEFSNTDRQKDENRTTLLIVFGSLAFSIIMFIFAYILITQYYPK